MFYEFKEEDAINFAKSINATTYVRGRELIFKECPYCHGKGLGNKEKFSINLDTGVYNCLRASCMAHGNMITLSKDFDFSLGREVDEYYYPRKTFRTFKKPAQPIIPKEPAVRYLMSRGISEAVAKKYQITTQNEHDNILVFPFFDENGNMTFIKYRKTDFVKGRDNNKEWCESNAKPILFGMYQCNLQNKTLVITEGQIDSLSLAQAGIENAVSVPTGANGFTWNPYCRDWVEQFHTIIIFGDYEKGRITLLSEIKQRYKKKVIKFVKPENYRDCKDANEILRKYGESYLRKCVEDAEEIPLMNVLRVADVKKTDIYNAEKLPTGFGKLDDLLYGGLPFSGITLITGKTGKGKSTFASQILCSALEHGHKVFAYSGELENDYFKSWVDFQLAGSNHLIMQNTRYGKLAPKLSDTNEELIRKWYENDFYMFDSASVDDEHGSLIGLMEDVIIRYGTRVLLLDNLMTGLDLENSGERDKFERQSRFVKKLTRMAMQYDVAILLVAHKRKGGANPQDESDEVSGSSDITNLCKITLSYDEGTQKEIQDGEILATQRKLKLIKNRCFGGIYPNGWIMDYDPKSKRVYGEGDDPNFEYGWTKGLDNGFDAVPNEQEIPW